MRVAVRKWGNSLALRIPKSFADDTHIESGTEVEVTLEAGRLIVTPVPTPAVTLEALLVGVTLENTHGEIATGPATGREVW